MLTIMEQTLVLSLSEFDRAVDLSKIDWYSHYRRHPGFSALDVRSIEEAGFHERVNDALSGCFFVSEGAMHGFALVLYADWDSNHFDIPMATIKLGTTAGVSAEELSAILRVAIDSAMDNSEVRHFSLAVDCDNYVATNAAIRCGFEVMDVKRTYLTNKLYANPAFERFKSSIRDYREDDFDAVQRLLDDVSFESRFSRDVFLDQVKVRDLYRRWFNKMLLQAGGETSVMVGLRNNNVVACHALGEIDFSPYGVEKKIRAGSLFAASPAVRGLYGPVSYQSALRALKTHDVVEATVSLNHSATTRAMEAIRPNRTVASYSFRLNQ